MVAWAFGKSLDQILCTARVSISSVLVDVTKRNLEKSFVQCLFFMFRASRLIKTLLIMSFVFTLDPTSVVTLSLVVS